MGVPEREYDYCGNKKQVVEQQRKRGHDDTEPDEESERAANQAKPAAKKHKGGHAGASKASKTTEVTDDGVEEETETDHVIQEINESGRR